MNLSEIKLNKSGFTLLEVVIVMVIVGIISFVVVADFESSHTHLQIDAIIEKIASDIRYARELAMTHGQGTQIHIDVANNQYYLKWDDDTFIDSPMKGGDFVIQLGTKEFSDVQITDTSFTSGRMDFNTGGQPLNAGNEFSGTLTLVAINNSKKIVITAYTGYLKIEDL